MDDLTKQRWINALRSGKYVQTKHFLRRNDDSFCALGVLADVINPDNWNYVEGDCQYSWQGWSCTLPTSLLHFPLQNKISDMNDDMELSFRQISDWIEKEV